MENTNQEKKENNIEIPPAVKKERKPYTRKLSFVPRDVPQKEYQVIYNKLYYEKHKEKYFSRVPKKPLPHAKKGRKQYDPNVVITDEDRKNKTHVCEYCGRLVSLPHLALHLKSQMCQNAKAALNQQNDDTNIDFQKCD